MLYRISALICSLCAVLPAHACTLWAAAGHASTDGTLLVKNRDWAPDHQQSLRLVKGRGYAFVGLYADGGRAPGIKAGVNQEGLSVVSASASSLARSLRMADSDRHGVMTQILRKYGSVAELEADASHIFSQARPIFLMVADQQRVLQVEVGQDGRFNMQEVRDGSIAHTNHYTTQGVLQDSQKPGDSSQTRLARIQALLAEHRQHSAAEFAAISKDRHDGPDNSLWRNGKEYTLASWQIALPKRDSARLHLVLANPGQAQQTLDYRLNRQFWAQPSGILAGKGQAGDDDDGD